MYWSSILYFLTWPVVVVLSYQLIKYVVMKYKEELDKVEE